MCSGELGVSKGSASVTLRVLAGAGYLMEMPDSPGRYLPGNAMWEISASFMPEHGRAGRSPAAGDAELPRPGALDVQRDAAAGGTGMTLDDYMILIDLDAASIVNRQSSVANRPDAREHGHLRRRR